MSIGDYCRTYRRTKGVTLNELTEGQQVKTLSSFEHGRSSNVHHLKVYIELSVKHGDEINFMNGLLNVIKEC